MVVLPRGSSRSLDVLLSEALRAGVMVLFKLNPMLLCVPSACRCPCIRPHLWLISSILAWAKVLSDGYCKKPIDLTLIKCSLVRSTFAMLWLRKFHAVSVPPAVHSFTPLHTVKNYSRASDGNRKRSRASPRVGRFFRGSINN